HRRDLTYSAWLILIASIPLIVLRNLVAVPAPVVPLIAGLSVALFLGVLWAWCRAARDGNMTPPPRPTGDVLVSPARWAAIAALLAALTAANFYFPLRKWFWSGGDEHIIFTDLLSCFWNREMDLSMCRPLWLLPIGLGRLMTPDRMDGFLV